MRHNARQSDNNKSCMPLLIGSCPRAFLTCTVFPCGNDPSYPYLKRVWSRVQLWIENKDLPPFHGWFDIASQKCEPTGLANTCSIMALIWSLTKSALCGILSDKATQSVVTKLPNRTSVRSLKEHDRRMLELRCAGRQWNVAQSNEGKDQEIISPKFLL